jgi:hypothetical protein
LSIFLKWHPPRWYSTTLSMPGIMHAWSAYALSREFMVGIQQITVVFSTMGPMVWVCSTEISVLLVAGKHD